MPPKYRHFYLKLEISPADLVRKAGDLADEVVRHLAKEPRVKVRVVLEVHAEAEEGFSEDLARVLKENSQVLGATPHLE